jgi:hypothetical protein
MAGNEDTNDDNAEVSLSFGEVTEGDLQIKAADIQQMVVAPTDWTISVLVELLKRNKIDLQPNYQRRVAWDDKKMSRFIESLFLRLPVPQVVLAEMSPGRFAVIDGKQRMNSIARFCLDSATPLKLENCEYRPDLNGLTYDDIESIEKLEPSLDAFQNHTVRTIVIKNWKSDALLYLLFLRLNQNSVSLSPQELRRALYPGKFMNWLDDKTAVSDGMKTIFNKVPDFRMRDMEVATRHLAFHYFADQYSGNMKNFLDLATKQFTVEFDSLQGGLEADWTAFEDSIAYTVAIFSEHAFRSRIAKKFQGSKNRAVMDIMTYYFAIPAVREASAWHFPAIKQAFENLCDTKPEFLNALQTSTKTARATSQRFHDWGDALRAIVGNVVPEFPLPRNTLNDAQ